MVARELGAEVDRQLPRGLAGLGELIDCDDAADAADAHVDCAEVVESITPGDDVAGGARSRSDARLPSWS